MALQGRLPVTLLLFALSTLAPPGCSRHHDEEQPSPLALMSGSVGTNVACTDILVLGIALEVRDARTGLPAAEGARGVIRDGAYREMLAPPGAIGPDTLYLSGAAERPGVYDVVLRKPGYQPWRAEDVAVAMDATGCHVVPVRLLASLEPRR